MSKDIRENQQKANERKLLEAKINDKYKFACSKNKITHTDFLNTTERSIAEKFLRENLIHNYIFFGGYDDADRNLLIFYPQKFSKEMVKKNYSKFVSILRINLPKNTSYEHRIYLSGIMKLGIKREKIGDILVKKDGADIIILNEMIDFLKNNLSELTRFKMSKFDIIDIKDIQIIEKQFEEFTIIVSSMRLDSFVSALAKTSRTNSLEIINEQKVFVNYNMETKLSKKINLGDIINIRGKGKYIVEKIDHKTKTDRLVINIKKYI